MNAIQNLNYENQQLRMTEIDGEPWWVAKDVCDILEIQNTTQAIQALDDDERSMFNIGRGGETNVVNEPGLYCLIFNSRKPSARAFKRWVTHEVLPAIRRDGIFFASGTVPAEIAEIAALEYRLAAAKKRLEARELECRAKLVQRIDGAIPINEWIKEQHPELDPKERANLSRSIKRCIVNQLRRPVGVSRKHGNKLAAALVEDIAAAVELLKPTRKELN